MTKVHCVSRNLPSTTSNFARSSIVRVAYSTAFNVFTSLRNSCCQERGEAGGMGAFSLGSGGVFVLLDISQKKHSPILQTNRDIVKKNAIENFSSNSMNLRFIGEPFSNYIASF